MPVSSIIDFSGKHKLYCQGPKAIKDEFLDCLIFEDCTDMFFPDVSNTLPINATQHSRGEKNLFLAALIEGYLAVRFDIYLFVM